ncbi:unnamed protein product [Symbiodinium natans]|uniref:Uncharacterized protein n=1 Tax=Symbiodinium natans TaxID=878477 RepID=A0A812SX97_9DINO|nr:unnamed protein product [Symbiodinium natans]
MPPVTALWVKEGVAALAVFNDGSCEDLFRHGKNLCKDMLGDIVENDGGEYTTTPLLQKSLEAEVEPFCSAHCCVVSGNDVYGVGAASNKKQRTRAAYVAAAVHEMARKWQPSNVEHELLRRGWQWEDQIMVSLTKLVAEAVECLNDLRKGPQRQPPPPADTSPPRAQPAPPPSWQSSRPTGQGAQPYSAPRVELWHPDPTQPLTASDVRKTTQGFLIRGPESWD